MLGEAGWPGCSAKEVKLSRVLTNSVFCPENRVPGHTERFQTAEWLVRLVSHQKQAWEFLTKRGSFFSSASISNWLSRLPLSSIVDSAMRMLPVLMR